MLVLLSFIFVFVFIIDVFYEKFFNRFYDVEVNLDLYGFWDIFYLWFNLFVLCLFIVLFDVLIFKYLIKSDFNGLIFIYLFKRDK